VGYAYEALFDGGRHRANGGVEGQVPAAHFRLGGTKALGMPIAAASALLAVGTCQEPLRVLEISPVLGRVSWYSCFTQHPVKCAGPGYKGQ
jgi:hypothetical protein